mgnify:CR=1 FL=1
MSSKQSWLFERDEHGELLPKKVFVKVLNEEILVTPLTWGEWKKTRNNLLLLGKTETSQEDDAEMIVKHCKQPSFTIDEAKSLKSYVAEAITNSIYEISGLVAEKTEVKESESGVPK